MTPTDRQCSLSHVYVDVYICPEQLQLHIYKSGKLCPSNVKLYLLASQPPDVYYKLIFYLNIFHCQMTLFMVNYA